jgi:hypothetical protein
MNPKHRPGADFGQRGNGSSLHHERDIDVLTRTTELALESAKAILDRYDELMSTAHRETALLLWRGITPPPLEDHLRSSLEVTKRAVIASLSQGITLAEIAARLQLEGIALFRQMATESLVRSPSLRPHAGTKRDAP